MVTVFHGPQHVRGVLVDNQAHLIGQSAFRLELEHGEVFSGVHALELDAELPAHQRLVAIGSEHEGNFQLPRARDHRFHVGSGIPSSFLFERIDGKLHRTLTGFEPGQSMAPFDLDPFFAQGGSQQLLETGLRQDRDERIVGVQG